MNLQENMRRFKTKNLNEQQTVLDIKNRKNKLIDYMIKKLNKMKNDNSLDDIGVMISLYNNCAQFLNGSKQMKSKVQKAPDRKTKIDSEEFWNNRHSKYDMGDSGGDFYDLLDLVK